VSEVLSLLRGYTAQEPASTYLSVDCTSGDLTLTVNDGTVVTSGVIEIDDEQMLVESSSGGAVTIPPYGRGYNGTVAAAHVANTQVTVDPAFPRKSVIDAVGHTALAVYPTLFAPKPLSLAYTPAVASYDLAADADRILRVTAQTVGPSKIWREIQRYDLDTDADTSVFPSGKSITLRQSATPGQTVRVVYAGQFGTLAVSADTLATAGFAESMSDVLIYGAVFRLVQFLDVQRLQQNSVEAEERAKYAPPGSASTLARQIFAIYNARVGEERAKLLLRYPTNIRFGRS